MTFKSPIYASLKPDASGALPPLWFILGSEPLLAVEAQDAIRAKAAELGYTERKSFTFEGNADYSPLYEALGDMSLFGEKTIIEITFPRSTIGKNGPDAVEAAIRSADENKLIVVSLFDYDWAAEKKSWFQNLKKSAKVISADPVPRNRLPQWIETRFKDSSGLAITPEAAAFISEKTEGNLLATMQEIRKITLLCQKPEITLDDVMDCVSDVSRFTEDALFDAIYAGDAARISKAVDSLAAESVQIPAFLWILARDARTLLLLKQNRQAPMFGISPARAQAMKRCAGRLSLKRLESYFQRISEIDKLSKGIFVDRSDGDPWQELKATCLLLSASKN